MLCSSAKDQSNLERFLREITPKPVSRSLSLCCTSHLNSLWQQPGKEVLEYFKLGDLWNCYGEWSAFSLGTRVELNSGETVTQFFVPYLSAIQIFTNKSTALSRNGKDDNEAVDTESECWSDDSGSEKLSRSLSNNSSKTWDEISEEDSSLDQEKTTTWTMRDKLGYLYFQYFETDSPYCRVPIGIKMTELAGKFPGLATLRSIDISPASWMAIAWYPIYHIPSRKNEKDLSSCFLTYHTLSSSFQDTEEEEEAEEKNMVAAKTACPCSEHMGKKKIPLAPYGLATYKMKGDLWAKPGTRDHERLGCLQSAADSWLKQLNVYHHDYNFFAFHSTL